MTARHSQVKSIFLEACGLPSEQRSAFLEQACRDPELRSEVEALLTYHDRAATEPVRPDLLTGVVRGEQAPITKPMDRFVTGRVFAGRYRMVSELGRGGMGQVFRAHDLFVDQEVAVKFLPSVDARRIDLLRQEVRLARQVTHGNVCRVFDFGEAEGETFLTMEYIDGENLSSLLGRIGRLPQDKLLDIAHQLCAGLAAAHAQGVLHRDLKPANVMIDGRGKARLTDFGIATSVAASRADGMVIGTPAYIAPEQWTTGQATVQSDLYALGLLLHEMATGEPVFQAHTPAEYADLHQRQTPESPRFGHLDARLEAVIQQCLEKDPRDRPKSAMAAAAALPGGDRLQRALDAGETPSPELVAAAGNDDAPKTSVLLAALSLLGLFLVGLVATADRAFPSRQPWAHQSPEVLVRRAADILEQLGHDDLPVVGRSWGFRPDYASPAEQDVHLFWYRQGMDELVPSDLDLLGIATRVSYYDPAPIDEGMVQMLLDTKERLVTLKVIPAGFDGQAGGAALDLDAAVDWQPALAAAGFDPASLSEVTPNALPPMYAQQRRAWESKEPAARIEAAALGGKVVFLDVRMEEIGPPSPVTELLAELWHWYVSLGNFFWIFLTVGVALIARGNLRHGRGDLRGARRLAITVVSIQLLRWLLASDHFVTIDIELTRLLEAAARIIMEALLVWLAYLALEPLVRRQGPHALIAWSRLWRGRWTDPKVGRATLIGLACGAGWALLVHCDRLLVFSLGWSPAGELLVSEQLDTALAGRQLVARVLESSVDAIYWGLLGLFFLTLLETVLRRRTVAAIVFVVVLGLFETLEGMHPQISWLTLGLAVALTSLWLLRRQGLLAYVAALFCYQLLTISPITRVMDSWYASISVFAIGTILALALLAARIALAGRLLAVPLLAADPGTEPL